RRWSGFGRQEPNLLCKAKLNQLGWSEMSNRRIPRWLLFCLSGLGVLVVGVPSLVLYQRLTATRVNPDPEHIASVTNAPPSARWAAAVEQGRGVVRTTLSRENVPGMSVAVGVDGEIVWAEGFGFANIENNVRVTPDHRFSDRHGVDPADLGRHRPAPRR